MEDNIDDIKIVFVGYGDSGKTCFMNRWTKNIWIDGYKATIVSEFGFKIFEQNGKIYRIQIWDLASQDKEFAVTKVLAKGSHGCVIVSDSAQINDREE